MAGMAERGRSVNPMCAAIYARYSSNLQSEASIEDQIRVCSERIAHEGWALVSAYSDYAVSGAVRDRPNLDALLDSVAADCIDLVITESLDRLSRDLEDIAGIFKRISYAGAKIITLAEGEISELHVGLKGTMAALYRKDMAEGRAMWSGKRRSD